jgi:serine/threonine protein phosphatase PrpC
MNNLSAVVTDTRKSTNQDHCFAIDGVVNAVLVADGIGSALYAANGSKKAVMIAQELLSNDESYVTNMKGLFWKIQDRLDQEIEELGIESLKEGSFGTTLIVAIETEEKFVIGYVGNGAIFHLKGNITDFNENAYFLPWNYNNYLNPHTKPYEGKEALYKYFGYKNKSHTVTPTIIEVSKDLDGTGDIIMICTDGIYSQDHIEIEKDSKENLWIEGTKPLSLLLDEVKNYLKEDIYNEVELEQRMNIFLKKLKEIPDEMSDDCTLGILISEQVLRYQQKSNNGNHTDSDI